MTNENLRYIPPLIGALVIAILPHLERLPLWIIAWCAVMWGYRLLSLKYRWPLPGKWARLGLTLAGLAGLLVTFSDSLGPIAYLSLLAVMAAIKPFETSSHRDRMIMVFLAYFIVITGLFQSESLMMILYMLLSVGFTTAVLVRINDNRRKFSAQLKLAGLLLAQALPLMAILFLLFPRLQGSVFGLSRLQTATTGFSDSLRPGSVSRLAENEAVAFRVTFADDEVPSRPLYWRGVVFQQYDGRGWQVAERVPELPEWTGGPDPVEYEVSIEPHNNRWLFALDLPAESPRWTKLRADYTLRTIRPVRNKHHYRMTSYTNYRADQPRGLVEPAGRLPDEGNPGARGLARQLAGEADSVEDKVQKVLDYFREEDFVYTLNPPPLGNNFMDDFLLESRQGYCEHYASALAFLMRVVGVPARVVGGYLGGEANPYSDYLIIRQSHAHAWVEIWQKEKGWIRVDPTAAVAPGRISGGRRGGPGGDGSGGFFLPLLSQLQLRWDAVSTAWEEWFTGYSQAEQQSLLERLGLARRGWSSLISLLGLLIGLLILVSAIYLKIHFSTRRGRADPVRRSYLKFCGKLARRGLVKDPAVGPRDFAELVARQRPDLAGPVDRITGLYVRLRFQENPEPGTLAEFKKEVRAFHPSRVKKG